ncbi:hypothetical protein F2Q69_00035573 [Brassica cretica]|uniref:Uncharacterized protein n=1 Tax=Brassica cretica TaxID=69181 RepID=A0A8S9SBP7_BRACR|nr:hypothetical protein F2Q69_00035573 [Brassica cretica]
MSLRGSYCKAPMVTLINTKRGIDPSRFGKRHKVRSASSYNDSGGVGRCVMSNSPNGRVGLLVWFRDPFLSSLLL